MSVPVVNRTGSPKKKQRVEYQPAWALHDIDTVITEPTQMVQQKSPDEDMAEQLDQTVFKIKMDTLNRVRSNQIMLEADAAEAKLKSDIEKAEDEREQAEENRLERRRKKELERNPPPQQPVTTDNVQSGPMQMSPELQMQVASMPAEQQAAFFNAYASAELKMKNPQMAMTQDLLTTYKDTLAMKNQPQGGDFMEQMSKFMSIQKQMREEMIASDPRLSAQPINIDPNSPEAMSKKFYNDIVSKAFDELLHGKKDATPGVPGPVGTMDTSMDLMFDESTNMYLPKKLTDYNQYLEINAKRDERLAAADEFARQENRDKMIQNQIVKPLMDNLLPIAKEAASKGVDRMMTKSPRVSHVSEVPAGEVTTEESDMKGAEILNCKCGNKIVVKADGAGIWPDKVHCIKCNANYSFKAEDDGKKPGKK